MKKKLTAILSTVLAILALFVGVQFTPPAQGSFTPVQCAQTTLSGAGANATATTINLTSFQTPGGIALTMAMFGQVGYAVVDSNSPTKVENVSFTGITQNANGTAQLTGVTRGLDFVSPYSASTTLQHAHTGGAYLICSNPAVFYGAQFPFLNNASSIQSVWTYASTSMPRYDVDPSASQWSGAPLTALVDLGKLNATAFGSSPVGVSSGGTGLTTVPAYTYLSGNGISALIATSSPTAGYFTATSTTATSTFGGGVVINNLSNTNNVTIGGTLTVTGIANLNGGSLGLPNLAVLGSGTDGSVTYSSGTTTLSQDLYAQNITISAGAVLKTGGYRIFATGTVDVAGKLDNSGLPGQTVSGGTGGTGGAAASSTTVGGATAGGVGGNQGASGSAGGNATSIGYSKGGSGGASSPSGGGGSFGAGLPGTAVAAKNRVQDLYSVLALVEQATTTTPFALTGGAGGGGGGGGTPASAGGGGGGGGGGVMSVIAKNITVESSGLVWARGGDGGSAVNQGGGAGAGGGGGGGFIMFGYTGTYTNSGSVSVAGGALGTAQANSSAGSTGTVITVKLQ